MGVAVGVGVAVGDLLTPSPNNGSLFSDFFFEPPLASRRARSVGMSYSLPDGEFGSTVTPSSDCARAPAGTSSIAANVRRATSTTPACRRRSTIPERVIAGFLNAARVNESTVHLKAVGPWWVITKFVVTECVDLTPAASDPQRRLDEAS